MPTGPQLPPRLPPGEAVTVRALRAADFAEVARVAYATGFFGAPATRSFPDRGLFGDLWVRPYFVGAPFGFAAERGGELLGYVVGTPDWGTYRRAFARTLPGILARALRGGYPALPGSLPYLLRLVRYTGLHAPEAQYPAHLHLNLLPESRGLGLGGALLDAYLGALRARGVPGLQLSTTRENRSAVALYERRGLTVWSARESALWQPWLGRPAIHLVMTRRLGGPPE
ncbi:N-acetyltransferase GCN5 [Deinococcus phoenicis]|uniref:N-acetyltransferase GCN5 n=1 Tax=Deinococcus phoenicis TaxID=1476583 RepID=A0A016QNW0_9DEIO|nr:GNAT family N-acetyltransferase [Deinococcus phoenicis]EYB67676.1 N-acetyltransferase GCN5 [Deinococcus phoenicis]